MPLFLYKENPAIVAGFNFIYKLTEYGNGDYVEYVYNGLGLPITKKVDGDISGSWYYDSSDAPVKYVITISYRKSLQNYIGRPKIILIKLKKRGTITKGKHSLGG